MGFIDDVKEVGKGVLEVTKVVGQVTKTIGNVRDTITAEGGILGLGILSTGRTFVKEKPTPKVVEKAKEVRKKAPSVNKTRKAVKRVSAVEELPLEEIDLHGGDIFLVTEEEKAKEQGANIEADPDTNGATTLG
jgi:hypothetical protein